MHKWKDIVDYEGYYQVSNLGRVRSVDRVVRHARCGTYECKGRILCPCTDSYGYLVVTLYKNGRRNRTVHKLVAEAFLGSCPDGMEVRHGAGGILDNSVSNLCYGTSSENQLDRIRDGTTNRRRVRRSDGIEFISILAAARQSGCDSSAIAKVCKGLPRYKTAGGFSWKYLGD